MTTINTIPESKLDPSQVEWLEKSLVKNNVVIVIDDLKKGAGELPKLKVLVGLYKATILKNTYGWTLTRFLKFPCFEIASQDVDAVAKQIQDALPGKEK